MKKLSVFLFALAALAVCAPAAPDPAGTAAPAKSEETGKPAVSAAKAKGVKKPTPTPAATPEKKPSLFKRMFGVPLNPKPTDPKATPATKGKPTPAPKGGKPTPAPAPKPKGPAKPKTANDGEASNTEPPKTKGEEKEPNLDISQAPGTEIKPPEKEEPSPVDEDNKERERFNAVRTKAMQDKSVAALKEKAEAASDDAGLRKTSKEYYKALYKKMRSLDGSLKTRIDQTEAAVLKRFESGDKE